jgi:DNA-binding IclR family transcriptional regulator
MARRRLDDYPVCHSKGGGAMLIAVSTAGGQQASVRLKRPSERRSLSRSATRALDVLEFFGEVRRPLRAVEISRMLAMHPSTTNQLLKTMVDSAHLVFDANNKTYLPSPRLAKFSAWVGETYEFGGRLRELIQDVQARTHVYVTITTPNDLFMQVIDLANPVGQQIERGLRISVFGSVIGSAYLSMLEESQVKRLADRARMPATEVPTLLRDVARIRSDGYADGPSTGDTMWSIAMPLPKQGLRVPTVLGLAGPTEHVRKQNTQFRQTMSDAITRWVFEPVTHR